MGISNRFITIAAAAFGVIAAANFSGTAAAAASGNNSMTLAEERSFEIDAQPLGLALKQFAGQAGMQIMFAPEMVEGRTSPMVQGRQSGTVALRRLLAGSGLDFAVEGMTIAVRSGADAPAAAAMALEDGAARLAQAGREASPSSQGVTGVPTREGSAGSAVEEVVVTAQRREESLIDVPISISVLDGRALDQSTARSVNDALAAVPGIVFTENYLGGGSTIAVRGVTSARPTQVGPATVGYYLDSAPFALVRSAIGPDANPFDLERVEVLRGPQGTLYGSSALNGVVRILTHDPDLDAFDVKARTIASSTEDGGLNYRGDLALNIPLITDKFAIRAVVGYQQDEGWIDQPNRKNANDREIQTYRVKLKAKPVDELTISLSAWMSRDDADMPPFGSSYNRNRSVLAQPASTHYDLYSGTLEYDLGFATLAGATSYLRYANTSTLGLDVPTFNAPNTIFFTRFDSDIFTQEAYLRSSENGPWRWSVGGMYRQGTEDLGQYYTGGFASIPQLDYRNTSKSYALFGELTRTFFDDALEVTGGLRYFSDDESQDHQTGLGTPFRQANAESSATTPRAIVTWHPHLNTTVYASYSEGFRSGYPQNDGVLVNAPTFPDAGSDRLRNYEVGTKGRLWSGAVEYDLALYYMDWQDIQLQLTVPFFNGVIGAVVNGNSASGLGVDAGLTIRPAQDFTLQGAISWNDLGFDQRVLTGPAELFAEGDRPNGSPELTVSGSADYAFDLGTAGYRGHLTAGGNYTSSLTYRTATVIQTAGPIFVARAALAIEAPANWTATFFVDNINNEKRPAVAAGINVLDWNARVTPRTYGLQVSYRLR